MGLIPDIEEIRGRDTAMRNLVIHVTDEALLEKLK